jgi:hypothetical protein
MIIPALQMIAGFRSSLLPKFVRQREIKVNHLREFGEKVVPLIEQIERFIKPRWLILTLPPMPTIIGILA